tara:strand:+ start:33 stop:230 length:198 start_codon:yes stop_codon:yes gene_type:complete
MPAVELKKNNQNNRELLEEILSEIQSLKSTITEIRIEISKLNQIENKLKKGENLANSNGGWFWSS